MGIGSWWKRLMKREDEAALEREVEREHETREEQRFSSGDMEGLQSDEFAARSMHEGNVEDAEAFGDEENGPPSRSA
jgi:hypothetical protein